jgi:protein arginine kinase activator
MKCQRCPKTATLHITEVLGEDRYEEVPAAGPACEACGLTYLEFRNQGRFGCAHDYDAFKAELLPLLESIHGDVRHAGKAPRRLPRTPGTQAELTTLRRRLQQLVTEENYEEAARIRDRIKELENS